MGLYTEHWRRYRVFNVRGTWYALLMFAVCLPLTALLGFLLEPLDGLDTPLLVGTLALWLIAFTVLMVRYSRVECPRCHAHYSRGRSVVNCPQCGLRMLQEDP